MPPRQHAKERRGSASPTREPQGPSGRRACSTRFRAPGTHLRQAPKSASLPEKGEVELEAGGKDGSRPRSRTRVTCGRPKTGMRRRRSGAHGRPQARRGARRPALFAVAGGNFPSSGGRRRLHEALPRGPEKGVRARQGLHDLRRGGGAAASRTGPRQRRLRRRPPDADATLPRARPATALPSCGARHPVRALRRSARRRRRRRHARRARAVRQYGRIRPAPPEKHDRVNAPRITSPPPKGARSQKEAREERVFHVRQERHPAEGGGVKLPACAGLKRPRKKRPSRKARKDYAHACQFWHTRRRRQSFRHAAVRIPQGQAGPTIRLRRKGCGQTKLHGIARP